MKALKISIVIFTALLVAAVFSSGLVSAITSDRVYIKGFVYPSQQLSVGDKAAIQVFIVNNSTETITIDYIGVHFSWMPSETLYGYNLSSTPITIGADDDYFFPQTINITVPAGSGGNQSYYVGIDGKDSSSNSFSFNSDTVELIISGSGATTAPTNNNGGTNNGSGTGFPSIILYGIVIAVIAVVAVLLVVVLMRRGQKPNKPSARPSEEKPAPTAPEEKPSSGQDFSI